MDAARAALAEKAEQLRQAGTQLRLDDLADAFGLEPFDVELLLVGLAPDLDLLSKSCTAISTTT